MKSALVRTINESASQLVRLYALTQDERATLTEDLIIYLKRLSFRYKIMSSYLVERLEEYERSPTTFSQEELLEAVMAFKQDSEVFESVLNPLITLSLCETEARKDRLLITGEHYFDTAFKVVKTLALPVGVQSLLDNEQPPSARELISLLRPSAIESILQDKRINKDGVKTDLINALKALIPHPSKQAIDSIRQGKLPGDLNFNFLYSRKVLFKIQNHYEV